MCCWLRAEVAEGLAIRAEVVEGLAIRAEVVEECPTWSRVPRVGMEKRWCGGGYGAVPAWRVVGKATIGGFEAAAESSGRVSY